MTVGVFYFCSQSDAVRKLEAEDEEAKKHKFAAVTVVQDFGRDASGLGGNGGFDRLDQQIAKFIPLIWHPEYVVSTAEGDFRVKLLGVSRFFGPQGIMLSEDKIIPAREVRSVTIICTDCEKAEKENVNKEFKKITVQ